MAETSRHLGRNIIRSNNSSHHSESSATTTLQNAWKWPKGEHAPSTNRKNLWSYRLRQPTRWLKPHPIPQFDCVSIIVIISTICRNWSLPLHCDGVPVRRASKWQYLWGLTLIGHGQEHIRSQNRTITEMAGARRANSQPQPSYVRVRLQTCTINFD